MNLIKNYMTILEEAKKIIRSAEEHPEEAYDTQKAQTIYEMAFEELVAAGYPHNETDGEETLEIGDVAYSKPNKENHQKDVLPQPPARDEISEEPSYNEINEGEFSEYDEPVSEDYNAENIVEEYDEPDEPDEMDELDEIGDLGDALEFEEEPENLPEENSEPEVRTRSHSQMPSDMDKEDFTFNFDRILLSEGEEAPTKIKVIAFPVEIDEENPEFIVCAVINKETFVVKSNENSEVVINAKGHDITAYGKMENGAFITQYRVSEGDNCKMEVASKSHGDKGHIVLEDEGVEIHVLPVGSKNKSSGVADFIYYIRTEDEIKIGDTSKEDKILFPFQGKMMGLQARWHEEQEHLYCSVYEV